MLGACPSFAEATAVACMSRLLFNIPWYLCFANGFCIAAISPAVLVPALMILIEKKFGTAKNIP